MNTTRKVQVNFLSGDALNWAVRECLDRDQLFEFGLTGEVVMAWRPSTNGAQGARIIELFDIGVKPVPHSDGQKEWCGTIERMSDKYLLSLQYGPTFLITAMRALVAFKLGNEIDVPEVLLEE